MSRKRNKQSVSSLNDSPVKRRRVETSKLAVTRKKVHRSSKQSRPTEETAEHAGNIPNTKETGGREIKQKNINGVENSKVKDPRRNGRSVKAKTTKAHFTDKEKTDHLKTNKKSRKNETPEKGSSENVKSPIKCELSESIQHSNTKSRKPGKSSDLSAVPKQELLGTCLLLEEKEDVETGGVDDESEKCKPLEKAAIMPSSNNDDDDDDDSDEDIDWEDVKEAEGHHDHHHLQTSISSPHKTSPTKNVEISINVSGKKGKRKKTQEDMLKCIKRAVNRLQKEIQMNKHKVHLLALISRGFFRNSVCSSPILKAICLSSAPFNIIPKSKNKWDVVDVTNIVKWFQGEVYSLKDQCTIAEQQGRITRWLTPANQAEVFVILMRALGLLVRLVFSLQPVPLKAGTKDSLSSPKTTPAAKNDNCRKRNIVSLSASKPTETKRSTKQRKVDNKKKTPAKKRLTGKREDKTPSASDETLVSKLKETTLRRRKKKEKAGASQSKGGNNNKSLRKRKKVDYAYALDGGEGSEGSEEEWNESDPGTPTDEEGRSSLTSSPDSLVKTPVVDILDDDSDFEVTSKPLAKRRSSKGRKDSLKVISDDSDDSVTCVAVKRSKHALGTDVWVEVFLPSKKEWICVDFVTYSVNRPEECERYATQPIAYVLAYDNEKQQDKPLPQSIGEFKNHPLYVLRRHLLKFEAIYPESAATQGFIRGEAVYSRDCVHLLHTREKWMNEALVVKQGETPYKIVKGRAKRNKPVLDGKEPTIELFGRWQTEDYKPPPAVDGKVPRNEYGNVELFKPTMLPPGTRHIKIPGIVKMARKLGIDAAQAVIGFDFHCGFSHPIIDGVVVCEEHVDTLMDAWRQEQEEQKRKKEEKREKRVLGYWKLLVRSLLIRERLKRKYEVQESRASSECGELLEADEKAVDTTSVAWPLNMQEGKTSVDTDGHCHVFPKRRNKKDKVTGEWTKSCACGLTLPLDK
ncbi:DNA repair protein complementing XP-C cells isoform X2 [Nematostella vectensis]|uniref:DNA repair protein complementing XP-C cells isoform X2 n=1 Tax=Nematostella vectensis TaxID=45351 RepID=UPI002076EA6A|nr:DNA repair protein complementing XP-C cells isoform X2 [Nematostella vectensis]